MVSPNKRPRRRHDGLRCDRPQPITQRILLVGDAQRSELTRLAADCASIAELVVQPDPLAAREWLAERLEESGLQIDFGIIAPAHAGQFTPRDVLALCGDWPLTTWIQWVGSWSEGETRSGRPVPGLRRVAADQWPAWWRAVRDAKRATEPEGSRPWTTVWGPCLARPEGVWSDAARWSPAYARPETAGTGDPSTPTVIVWGHVPADRQALVDAVADWSWPVVGVSPAATTLSGRHVVGLYDAASTRAQRRRDLAWWRTAFADAPCVAVVNFPRHDEIVTLQAQGVRHVLAKPFHCEDLRILLDEAWRNRPLACRDDC